MKDRHNFIEFYITGTRENVWDHPLDPLKNATHENGFQLWAWFIGSATQGTKKSVALLRDIVWYWIFRHQTDPTFLYRNINYQRKDLKLKKQKSRSSEEKGNVIFSDNVIIHDVIGA